MLVDVLQPRISFTLSTSDRLSMNYTLFTTEGKVPNLENKNQGHKNTNDVLFGTGTKKN